MPDTIEPWDTVPVDDGNSWDDSVEIEDFEELPSTEFPTFPGLEPAEDDLVYWTRDKSLILVANAIRQKAGITERLVWPLGYRDAILGLSSIGASQSSSGQSSSSQSGTSQSTVITITPVEGSELMPMFVQGSFTGGVADTSGAVSIIRKGKFGPGLEFAVFPSATSMETYAFSSISSLSYVSLPMMTTIPAGAFYRCGSLASVETSGITSVGAEAFYCCYSLKSINDQGLTRISASAFGYCHNLKNVNFQNVTYISYSAFSNCSSLESAIMPNIASLGDGAFAICNSLSIADVGNLSYIPQSCFRGCTNLTSISASKVEIIYAGGLAQCGITGELYLPMLKSLREAAINYNEMHTLNAPLLTSISGGTAFQGCVNLESIIDGGALASMSSIGYGMFEYCHKLSSVSMPNAVRINTDAFHECGIVVASFPSVSYVGERAFHDCNSLITINMPEVLQIASSAFSKCGNLTSVEFPKVSIIGYSAFADCSRLQSVTLPEISTISNYAFDRTILKDMFLPGSIRCYFVSLGSIPNQITLHVPESLYNDYFTRYGGNSKFSIVTLE